MTELQVLSHTTLTDYLFAVKEVSLDRLRFETPVCANVVGDIKGEEEIHRDARGINEIHLELSSKDFNRLLDEDITAVEDGIEDAVERVRDDEVTFVTITYSGNGIFDLEEINALLTKLEDFADVIVSPLMSEQIDRVDIDEDPEIFERFVENTERFVGQAEEVDLKAPVLVSLPAVDIDHLDPLIDLVVDKPVGGCSVDFLGKKPTAERRVRRIVSPLLKRIGEEQLHRQTILYAVNAYRGKNLTNTSKSPAEDFFAFGLGFDILGGYWYNGQGTNSGRQETVTFRQFYRDTFEMEYVPVDDFEQVLPETTAFDADHLQRIAPTEDRFRAQAVLEREQMNLACNDLRQAILRRETAEYINGKAGTRGNLQERMGLAKRSYDEGAREPSLGSF